MNMNVYWCTCFLSNVEHLREGLPGSAPSHQLAHHLVLNDADDWHAPADQQGGHRVHSGGADCRVHRRCGSETLFGSDWNLPGQGLDGAVQLVSTLGAWHQTRCGKTISISWVLWNETTKQCFQRVFYQQILLYFHLLRHSLAWQSLCHLSITKTQWTSIEWRLV